MSRFLMNLNEVNLRSVRIDSDDPLYFSTHSESSLPSFVAAPIEETRGGTYQTIGDRNVDYGEGIPLRSRLLPHDIEEE